MAELQCHGREGACMLVPLGRTAVPARLPVTSHRAKLRSGAGSGVQEHGLPTAAMEVGLGRAGGSVHPCEVTVCTCRQTAWAAWLADRAERLAARTTLIDTDE